MLYYFVFLNLAIQGMKYNPSSQKRTVFYRTRNLIFQPMLLGASNFLLASLLLPLPAWLSAVHQWHLFCSILPAVACIFYLSHLHYFRPSGKRYQKVWDPPKYITHQKQNRKWKIFQIWSNKCIWYWKGDQNKPQKCNTFRQYSSKNT